MSRLSTIDPSQASGETGDLLGAVEQTLGVVPNMATSIEFPLVEPHSHAAA